MDSVFCKERHRGCVSKFQKVNKKQIFQTRSIDADRPIKQAGGGSIRGLALKRGKRGRIYFLSENEGRQGSNPDMGQIEPILRGISFS